MLHDTQIGRLQLHTSPNQPTACQADVARQLRQTRLHPTHLPGSAILVIRQLTSRRSSDLRRGNTVAWQKQLQQQIDGLARQAARPYQQTASDSAPSVLFLDSVELLVCFTQDLLAKRPRWYWQELFPDLAMQATAFTSHGEMMAAAWITYPEALPGTLTHLPKPLAAQALGLLNRAQLQRVIAALHQHFGLRTGASHSQEHGAVDRSSTSVSTPPWHTWVPRETAKGVQPLASYLWGVSHLLIKRPQVAHGPRFLAEAAKWIELQEAGLEEAASEEAALSPYSAKPPEHKSADADQEVGHDTRVDGDTEQGLESFTSCDEQTEPFANAETKIANPQTEIDNERVEPELSTPPQVDLESVQTQLGGAFYLLNVITWLDSNEALPEKQPTNPWIGVATLMAELLGERRDYLRSDPLWALLAQLANQPAEALWQALDQRLLCQESSDELVSTIQWWQVQFQQLIADQLTQRLTNNREELANLFCVPAHVRTTNTHIDVRFPNDAVNIDIRRSGLDRSPGWVPIFGYIITFIFD